MKAQTKIKNAAATREAILLAARELFAAESFEAVGMRDVARAADVNVALVSRYFGSKEELFGKVLLERGKEPWFGGARTACELAAWLGNLAMSDGADDHRADLERLYIILRSASSPATARVINEAFVEDVFNPLAGLLGAPDGEVRAGLALILVIGTTVLNGILSVQPISEELRETGRQRLVSLIEQALAAR
ncbi:TetR/AcrR family transcriptional regulator [Novosphingobium sp. 9U]|uniref:TetR/AcrR family transcriptional regulator n=1 Tax=Novosphingobium sp. 9U TaxID=2653158 RepID=UPI0012F2757B|nr:TetR/AcrR family transcriptional regulator [Novosphingobium sp. 9U]VWX50181.1 TetR/AcrR family transcriptional regulator [Novosphingobium sp. 9U]